MDDISCVPSLRRYFKNIMWAVKCDTGRLDGNYENIGMRCTDHDTVWDILCGINIKGITIIGIMPMREIA